jgi:hypothetical protein
MNKEAFPVKLDRIRRHRRRPEGRTAGVGLGCLEVRLLCQRASDEVSDGGCGVLLQDGDDVGLDLEGHGYRGVAKPFADDLGVHARL